MIFPSLTRTQYSSGSAPKSTASTLSGSIGSAAKKADTIRETIGIGTKILQNVKNETDKGKPASTALVCETIGTLTEEGSERAIQIGVIGATTTIAATEPWSLVPAAPFLLDTFKKANTTASFLGKETKSACYYLLGEKEKTLTPLEK